MPEVLAAARQFLPSVNVRLLGLVAMHEEGGKLDATAESNAAILNAYFAGEWRYHGLPLFFPAGGWLIADTIEVPAFTGFAMLGVGGAALPYVEDQYADGATLGGPVSRIVASATLAASGDPLLRLRSFGAVISDLAIQGEWKQSGAFIKTDEADGYPAPVGTDSRAALGIEILDDNANIGLGKNTFRGVLTVMNCVSGIECSATNVQYNADQCRWERLSFPGCDTGLTLKNFQGIAHRIDYLEGLWCVNPFKLEAGGKTRIGFLSMEKWCEIGVHITGNDQNGQDSGFHSDLLVDYLNLDEIPNTSRALVIAPTTGFSTGHVNIGCLRIQPTRTSGACIDVTNHYGAVNVYGGSPWHEGFVKVNATQNNQAFPTKFRFRDITFARGHDVNNVFLAGESTRFACWSHSGCDESDGTSGEVNDGRFFTDVANTLTDFGT